MTLRDFKEVFHSKACSQYVVIYYRNFVKQEIIHKVYLVLNDFYEDDYCDDMFIDFFQVNLDEVFINLKRLTKN